MFLVALALCAVRSMRSDKPIARDVRLLLFAAMLPMAANVVLVASEGEAVCAAAYYLYFLGTDWMLLALVRYSICYCGLPYRGTWVRRVLVALVAVDSVQVLSNLVTRRVFTVKPVLLSSTDLYYSFVSHTGHQVHLALSYLLIVIVLGVFVYKIATTPAVYLERYIVALSAMVIAILWESYCIYSKLPVDTSMVGYGIAGLLIFYFSLVYRPVVLLDRMLSNVVSEMGESVFFFETDGTCIYANDAGRELFGIADDDGLPACTALLDELVDDPHMGKLDDFYCQRSRTEDGAKRHYRVERHVLKDRRRQEIGAYASIRDVTEEEEKLLREKYLANHDRLTGLFTKEHFYEVARERIDAEPDVRYTVLACDIKDFKLVNDIFGKEAGDELLIRIARAIEAAANPGTVYGRLSSDRFGALVRDDEFDAGVVQAGLAAIDHVEGNLDHPIVIHVGLYEVTDVRLPLSVMVDRAYMAIASIKNEFQTRIAFYDNNLRDDLVWEQTIVGQLEDAIAQGQIVPYLQPQVNENGEVEGAEVLVRWIHPTEGFLPPGRFIPVFERNGMIARLDVHMWECACKLLKEWGAKGIDHYLSVNISPKDFYFIDVFGTITGLVEKYGIAPEKLRLEITETVMMTDVERRLEIIDGLRGRGFLVEMDDFGSGYSSLNMLKDFTVDVLKIDMMFLYKTKQEERAQTILESIIDLTDQLGIPSVTEGVETAEQLEMLVKMGCRMFQGYYFAKPMPVSEFEDGYQ